MNKPKQNKKSYVVLRNGIRVSDCEYSTKNEAKTECSHWKSIIKRWPDGSKIEVVEKNARKHRIYNL